MLLLDMTEIRGQQRPYQPSIGVYFLFLSGRLQYVGSSRNVHVRLTNHKRAREIIWDKYALIECDNAVQALRLEHAYIKKLCPPMNKVLQELDAPDGDAKLVKVHGPRVPRRRALVPLTPVEIEDPVARRRREREEWWRNNIPTL